MKNRIPAYIERRIRQPIPTGCYVVPGSTPVVSFGNSRTASVATLGLNPSRKEFLDRDGCELIGADRRLATHGSLGTSDLSTATPEKVAQVLNDCNCYFQRKAYWGWFDRFTPILAACGTSYRDGSACHLDLVQWATDPTWGKLKPRAIREQLIAADASFLAQQMQNERLRLLLVNGNGAMKQLVPTIVADLKEVGKLIGHSLHATRIFAGTAFGRVRVVAWSTNLQSSRGVKKTLAAALAKRIAAMVDKGKLSL